MYEDNIEVWKARGVGDQVLRSATRLRPGVITTRMRRNVMGRGNSEISVVRGRKDNPFWRTGKTETVTSSQTPLVRMTRHKGRPTKLTVVATGAAGSGALGGAVHYSRKKGRS